MLAIQHWSVQSDVHVHGRTWSFGTTPASILASIGTLHQHRAVPESHQISSCLILYLLYALAPTTDRESEKRQQGYVAEALLGRSSYICASYSTFDLLDLLYIGSPKLA